MPWQKPSTNHARYKHGRSHSTEYTIWRGIVRRCCETTHPAFRFYGARGVTVCDAWRDDFLAFLRDMGSRPSKAHSIDRIDTRGGYSKDNCRWATLAQQASNTRSNRVIAYDGLTLTTSEWARQIGISIATLNGRLRRGWDIERALSYRANDAPRKQRTCAPRVAVMCHCGRVAVARGLCGTHYASARDNGHIDTARSCACGKPHYAKGQCRQCYAKTWWVKGHT